MAAPPVLPPGRVLSVPLRTEVIGLDGRTFLAVWSGDAGLVVSPKRGPGFWMPSPDGRVAEVAEKRRLSDTSAPASTWYRLEFDTVREATQAAARLRKEGLGSYVGDDDRWSTRILVEDPDWFRQHAMTRPLRFVTVDIEQYTEGGAFPKPDAPLVSIALGDGSGREPWVVKARVGPDGMPDDENIVRAWRWALEHHDPDVVAAFNAGYDVTRLARRAAIHGYPFTEWGRTLANGERMYSYEYAARGRATDMTLYLGGRIVWDLRKNANSTQDYNLSGVKDERLKTIAKFLRYPGVIEEDASNTALLWRRHPGRLARYNASDVVLTERLMGRYLPDRVGNAEFYGAPLDMVLDASAGWGGTVANARVLFSQGIVSDGSNRTRHKQYLRFLPRPGGDEDEDEAVQFEGAHVAIYKRGRTAPLWKADFTSLYSNIARAARVGPDNTRIVGTLPLTAERSRFEVVRFPEKPGITHILVPDAKYGHVWVVEVRGESAFTPFVIERQRERNAAKKAGDATRAAILKTMLHATVWGSQGALMNRYGVLAVAIVIVGLAREMIRGIEDAVGDAKVETDTDGVYLDRRVSAALLTRAANKVAQAYGFEECFEVETERFNAGWFHETKTYLLGYCETLGCTDAACAHPWTIERHGVAMKGKALPRAFDRVIEEVGTLVLRGHREAAVAKAREFLDLKTFDPREFIQRARLNQPIDTYVAETKEVKIARAYERLYGVEPTVGTTYEYVKVRGGLREPPTPEALAAIDTHYYLDSVVLRALERIGITREELGVIDRVEAAKAQSKRPRGETSLFDFGATKA